MRIDKEFKNLKKNIEKTINKIKKIEEKKRELNKKKEIKKIDKLRERQIKEIGSIGIKGMYIGVIGSIYLVKKIVNFIIGSGKNGKDC